MELPPSLNIAQTDHEQPEQRLSAKPNNRGEGKRKRLRDWEEAETSALLECVNLPQFRHKKRNQSYMKWDAIAEEIQNRLGGSSDSAITGKRCKERMKTLRGYYQKARPEEKEADVTEDEWRKSNGLAVDWWYKAIGDFHGPREGKSIGNARNSAKNQTGLQMILPITVEVIMLHAHHNLLNCKVHNASCQTEEYNQGPCKARQGGSASGGSGMQMQCNLDPNATTNSLSDLLRSADNKPSEVQKAGKPVKQSFAQRFRSLNNSQRLTLLGLWYFASLNGPHGYICIWEVCEWLSITQYRRESTIYEDVKALEKMGFISLDSSDICIWKLFDHENFFKKVMGKNPAYDICQIIQYNAMEKLDALSEASFLPSRITMLHLQDCKELKVVDLSGFQKLHSLSIRRCQKVHNIIWCDYIIWCDSDLEELASLEITHCDSLEGYPPLQKFPSLGQFIFWGSRGYSSISGRGELDVTGCVHLRRLEIRDVDDLHSIHGLESLHSLTSLKLFSCEALQTLPDIGHMKVLSQLDIQYTSLQKIKGVEKLWSLERLDCSSSKLKTLPDLSHLSHLCSIVLSCCPVTKDPSSAYFIKEIVYFNQEKKDMDVNDASDSEQDDSDEQDDFDEES